MFKVCSAVPLLARIVNDNLIEESIFTVLAYVINIVAMVTISDMSMDALIGPPLDGVRRDHHRCHWQQGRPGGREGGA